jgi:hypothetical protein
MEGVDAIFFQANAAHTGVGDGTRVAAVVVGCSQNPLTTRSPVSLAEYPQVAGGIIR